MRAERNGEIAVEEVNPVGAQVFITPSVQYQTFSHLAARRESGLVIVVLGVDVSISATSKGTACSIVPTSNGAREGSRPCSQFPPGLGVVQLWTYCRQIESEAGKQQCWSRSALSSGFTVRD